MATKIVTIKDGQTIFDITLQVYGNISFVYKLIQENSNIDNINADIVNKSVVYEVQTLNLTNYFNTNQVNVSTDYPKAEVPRQFDDSFDFSFS